MHRLHFEFVFTFKTSYGCFPPFSFFLVLFCLGKSRLVTQGSNVGNQFFSLLAELENIQ